MQTRGIHSYETNYGTLEVNYDSAHYDFAHMPTQLTNTSTPQEVQAVAALMRDCGVAANMTYSRYASSAYDVDARAGLINFFCLSPDLSYAEKSFFADSVWENILRTDISANRPVMYSGHGTGNHSFICDGYKQDGFFHFNFGWGGYCDAWYQLSAVNPAQDDFSSRQTALLGIVPDSTGNVILGQMAGTSTFIVDEIMEFYHLLGHNAYHGKDLSESFSSVTNFIATDTLTPIIANLSNYGGDQSARIYFNSEGSYNMIYPTMLWFPAVESVNGIFSIDYSGNWHYAGFCLQISKKGLCEPLSFYDISSTVDTNQVILSWPNREESEWVIEYGSECFRHGNGAILTSDTTFIVIDSLAPYTYYDFYVKSSSSDIWTGPISVKTDLSYWQDFVKEQPEGIEYNEDGYALVSTPEQLAWLVRENSTCEKLMITADLDMSGHRWKPVCGNYYHGKELNGGNHSISNFLVRENKYSLFNYVGFYANLNIWSMTVSNLIFDSPNIISERSATRCGVLAGEMKVAVPITNGNNTIMNCGVNGGAIDCVCFSAGGLVGAFEGNMLNCSANLNINNTHVNPHTGGLIGDLYGGKIQNCYSASEIVSTPYVDAKGQIIGCIERGSLRNVYGKKSPYPLFYNQFGEAKDTSSFGENYALNTPIEFEDSLYFDLCIVLNKYVQSFNDSVLNCWQYDEILGYPVLSEPYQVVCSNVTSLRISNVIHNEQYALRLDWNDNNAESYAVKCMNLSDTTDTIRLYEVSNVPCFIEGLKLGNKYEVYVRCYCNETHSGWGEPVEIIFDKPYWTDIITSQPEEYVVDENGNVTISSAEGLSWLASCVNGLNGNEETHFRNKIVSLTSDIDLGQYKWMPIGCSQSRFPNEPGSIEFQGTFNGNGHVITNMYINEEADFVGFFGRLFQAKISNLSINNSDIKGLINVGALCGFYSNSNYWWEEFNYGKVVFDNCHVVQTDVYGKSNVGGLCGLYQPDVSDVIIRNCSSSGNVYGNSEFGGLIGFIAQQGNKFVQNCFSTSNVNCNSVGDYGGSYFGGFIGYAYQTSIDNCYTAGIVDTNYISGFIGSMIGVVNESRVNYMYGLLDLIHEPYVPWGVYSVQNTTMFSQEENLFVLLNPISITDNNYTDLLSALNAWVDVNNSDSIYCNWVADTAMVNGGFPIFAPMPVEPVGPGTEIDNYKETNCPTRKVFEDGKLYILMPNGTKYSATGKKVE